MLTPAATTLQNTSKYLESGKPLVDIRTACHAVDARGKAPEGHAEWPSFDPDVLGGHYTGHHANELKPKVIMAKGAESHPIMAGVRTPFTGQGSLYKTGPLAASARALLLGEIASHPVEPVAWVNLVGSSRVFYTSLGHPGDLDNTAFCRMLCRLLGHEPPAVGRTELDLDLDFEVAIQDHRRRFRRQRFFSWKPGFLLVGRQVDRGMGLRVCLKRWRPVD